MFPISLPSSVYRGLHIQSRPNPCKTLLLLIKVICSFGVAYKKSQQIRAQRASAFTRRTPYAAHYGSEQSQNINMTPVVDSSRPKELDKGVMQEEGQQPVMLESPIAKFTYESWAMKICQKGYSFLKLDERISKAIKQTDCLLSEPREFFALRKIANQIIEKRGLSQVSFFLRKKVFQLLFMAISDLQLDSLAAHFEQEANHKVVFGGILMKQAMQQLFDKVFYFKEGSRDHYFAFLGPYFEGGHNKAFIVLDLNRSKKRILRMLQSNSEKEVKNLRRENEIHRKLLEEDELKPCVIKMYQAFDFDSYHGSILEYADIGCLGDILGLPEVTDSDKKQVVELIVDFLQKIHEKGLVYGDLKSDNIFIKTSKKGKLKLKFGDFGGTYYVGEQSPCTTSPAMVPPESYTSIQTNQATDYWALGILLYEIKYCLRVNNHAFRQVPTFIEQALEKVHYFKGKSMPADIENATAIIKKSLQSPEEFINPQDPYDRLILALMQYDPGDRIDVRTVHQRLAEIPESSYSPTFLPNTQRSAMLIHREMGGPSYKLSGRIKTL
ncbi:MAG: protein kinase domain-containing protein [Parachlamydiaceae bacterium]